MWITFMDGGQIEAQVYQATGSALRVAVEGREELLDLTCIRGQWVSENCEPVTIEFAWQRLKPVRVPTLDECICSPALALKLMEAYAAEAMPPEEPLVAFGAAAPLPTC